MDDQPIIRVRVDIDTDLELEEVWPDGIPEFKSLVELRRLARVALNNVPLEDLGMYPDYQIEAVPPWPEWPEIPGQLAI